MLIHVFYELKLNLSHFHEVLIVIISIKCDFILVFNEKTKNYI